MGHDFRRLRNLVFGRRVGDAFPPLVFFHIGKTGGTSLIAYFQSASPHMLIEHDSDEVAGIEAALGGTPAEFIAGHYPVAKFLPRLPPDWLTMTVIRDPLWHIPSQYWHIRSHGTKDAPPAIQRLIALCNQHDFPALLACERDAAFEAHFDNPQTRAVTGKKSGPLDRQDLEAAKRLLSRLSFVGTTEHIDALAAHAAASLPWAHALRGQALPYVMVNPHNAAGAMDLPPEAARQLHALVEFDVELHRYAAAQQARAAPPDLAPASVAKSAAPRSRAMPVSDLVRVCTLEQERAALGRALLLHGNEVLLHPPGGADGRSAVTMRDIPFDGHSRLAGKLVVAHAASAPVRFDLHLVQGGDELVNASFLVSAGRPLDIALAFAPAAGPGQLTLATQMASPEAANGFAWATFIDLSIS